MNRPIHAAGAVLASLLLAAAMAACAGGSATASPAATAKPTMAATPPRPSTVASSTVAASASALASSSGAASASASVAATASETDDPAYHVDPALEAMLPSELMSVELTKFSLALDTYLHNSQSGDAALYTEWMHQLGLSVSDGTIAIAHDFSDQQNLTIVAIRPKGADAGKLSTALQAAANKLGWPIASVVMAQKTGLEVVDPNGGAGRAAAAAYIKNGVLFLVITDDPSLRTEVFIRLP